MSCRVRFSIWSSAMLKPSYDILFSWLWYKDEGGGIVCIKVDVSVGRWTVVVWEEDDWLLVKDMLREEEFWRLLFDGGDVWWLAVLCQVFCFIGLTLSSSGTLKLRSRVFTWWYSSYLYSDKCINISSQKTIRCNTQQKKAKIKEGGTKGSWDKMCIIYIYSERERGNAIKRGDALTSFWLVPSLPCSAFGDWLVRSHYQTSSIMLLSYIDI